VGCEMHCQACAVKDRNLAAVKLDASGPRPQRLPCTLCWGLGACEAQMKLDDDRIPRARGYGDPGLIMDDLANVVDRHQLSGVSVAELHEARPRGLEIVGSDQDIHVAVAALARGIIKKARERGALQEQRIDVPTGEGLEHSGCGRVELPRQCRIARSNASRELLEDPVAAATRQGSRPAP
jgi:hypothetical protein